MSDARCPKVTIVDFGMGNLFSVKHACEHVGLKANITASGKEILAADAVILPGVGAFGDAMASLRQLGLVEVLREVAASRRTLIGICLGMQLLMTRSYEFGHHHGLGVIEGEVVRFEGRMSGVDKSKVPQVGWNRIYQMGGASWNDSFLEGLSDGQFMYFVHSYYTNPVDSSLILSITSYADIEFCYSLARGNVFACQFHPERSGREVLRIYRNLARHVEQSMTGMEDD